MRLDLDELLRTGRWGPVAPGMSRAEIELRLGVPESWEAGRGGAGSRLAERWRYGSFELVFGDDQCLRSIFAEEPDRLNGGARIVLRLGLLAAGRRLSLAAARQGLAALVIPHTAWRQRVTGAVALTTEGGASLLFYGPQGEAPHPDWSLSALVVDGRTAPEPRLQDLDWRPQDLGRPGALR